MHPSLLTAAEWLQAGEEGGCSGHSWGNLCLWEGALRVTALLGGNLAEGGLYLCVLLSLGDPWGAGREAWGALLGVALRPLGELRAKGRTSVAWKSGKASHPCWAKPVGAGWALNPLVLRGLAAPPRGKAGRRGSWNWVGRSG